MKFILAATALVIAGVTFGAPGPGKDVPFSPNGVVLFDFEGPASIAEWSVRDLTEMRRSTRWAASGRACAAITYHKWSAGREQWPAVIALASRGALRVTDFSPFDALAFHAYNPQAFPVLIKLHLRDVRQKRFSRSFSLGAKASAVFRVPIRELAESIDVEHVAELHFYTTQPQQTYTVYVDDIRLTVDTPARARRVAARAAAMQARVEVLLAARQGDALPGPVRQWVKRIDRVQGAASAMEARFARGGIGDWAALKAAGTRLREWSLELDRLQGIFPFLRARAVGRKTGADAFVTAVESPMRKVFLDIGRFNSRFADSYSLEAARNEYESFQLIVFPTAGDLANVRCRVLAPLTGPAGARIGATVRLVGYVNCGQPSYAVPHTGWWPDPLLDSVSVVPHVPVGEVLPFWITVHVPEKAPAGTYTGAVIVTADGARPRTVKVSLTVWDFAVPRKTHLRTALSFRPLSGVYPADRVAEMTRKYENWMLGKYHLNPNNIYGGPPAWDARRLRELMDLGLNAINLAYLNAPRGKKFNAKDHWRSYEDRVRRIEKWLPVAEAAGARDLCFIYCFDERPANDLDVVYETAARLKKKWPDIEVMTTAYDRTFGLDRENGECLDIWVPLSPHFDSDAAQIARARRAGRDIWWYICIGPKHPWANWFIEYPAIEARLFMGAMTARYRPGGFLYYAVNRWPKNDHPIRTGPRTDWDPASYKNNNGDGSIMCAGPNGPLATIRLENIRDGIEDYEYYYLLRTLASRTAGASGRGRKQGPGVFGRFRRLFRFWGDRDTADPTRVSDKVVKDLTHFTHDPDVLLAERRRVAREILKLYAGERAVGGSASTGE